MTGPSSEQEGTIRGTPDVALMSIHNEESSSPTPFTRVKRVDIDRLSAVMPDLIRWRFYVFYAPFFSMLDLQQQEAKRLSSSRGALNGNPMSPLCLLPAVPQSRYDGPSDLMFLHASSLLVDLEAKLQHIDVISFYQSCTKDRATFQHYNKYKFLAKLVNFVLLNRQILNKLAQRLDIPRYQIEVALAVYSDFALSHQRFYTTSASPLSAYEMVGARRLAEYKDWSALAAIVHRDSMDVCTFRIFDTREREQDYIPNEMMIIKNAVSACRVRYFSKLDVERKRCGWSQRGDRGSHHLGVEATEMHNLRRLLRDTNNDGEGDDTGQSCGKCFFGLHIYPWVDPPLRLLGVRLHSECACQTEQRVVYNLSRNEDERLDGSMEMMEVICRTPKPLPSGRSATSARIRPDNPWSCRVKRVSFLGPIDEVDEETEI